MAVLAVAAVHSTEDFALEVLGIPHQQAQAKATAVAQVTTEAAVKMRAVAAAVRVQ